ncbi:hypothetical protein HUJ05_007831 [Dendroctonus ponderosae]|nr:hypothetical protein HUJ05_007831 [Dendroctonus ponderosae]
MLRVPLEDSAAIMSNACFSANLQSFVRLIIGINNRISANPLKKLRNVKYSELVDYWVQNGGWGASSQKSDPWLTQSMDEDINGGANNTAGLFLDILLLAGILCKINVEESELVCIINKFRLGPGNLIDGAIALRAIASK